MITVELYARARKHIGGWIGPDTRTMTREIIDQKFPVVVGIIGPAGPAGSGADLDLTHTFSFGDATPYLLGSLVAGKLVISARVTIENIFNGAGASISIGTLGNPNSVMATTSILPSEIGTYERAVSAILLTNQDLYLFIAPGAGASTGSGHLYVAVN